MDATPQINRHRLVQLWIEEMGEIEKQLKDLRARRGQLEARLTYLEKKIEREGAHVPYPVEWR